MGIVLEYILFSILFVNDFMRESPVEIIQVQSFFVYAIKDDIATCFAHRVPSVMLFL